MLSQTREKTTETKPLLLRARAALTITTSTTVQSTFQTLDIYHLSPSFKILPDNFLGDTGQAKYNMSLKYLIKKENA